MDDKIKELREEYEEEFTRQQKVRRWISIIVTSLVVLVLLSFFITKGILKF